MADGPCERVPTARPALGERERRKLNRTIRRGWISQGEYVKACEAALKHLTGRRYVLCVSSGTAALHLICLALGVSGSVVAVPTLAFAAVHNIPVLCGAKLRFMEPSPDNWQIEPQDLYYGPKQQYMIVAPCYGGMPDMQAIETICRARRIVLIEDAAESFAGSWNGRKAGTFGVASAISFYSNKIVVAGEGGAVLTDDESLYASVRLLSNHGIDNQQYRADAIGLNCRMTDMQAAVLLAQLERFEQLVRSRRKLFDRYREAASGKRLKLPTNHDLEVRAPWAFACTALGNVAKHFRQRGIETRGFFYPGHLNQLYHGHSVNGITDRHAYDVAKWLSRMGIILPTSSGLRESEILAVCRAIKELG